MLAALAITLALGCSEQPPPGPGRAERAGQKIDQAVQKAGQKTQAALEKAGQRTEAALEKAGDYASEKMKEAGKAIESAGEKLQK
jgi:hyperosmotically inducible periplasmic protein